MEAGKGESHLLRNTHRILYIIIMYGEREREQGTEHPNCKHAGPPMMPNC